MLDQYTPEHIPGMKGYFLGNLGDANHGYSVMALAITSFLTDEPNGQAAWDWIWWNEAQTSSVWSQKRQENPQWAILPREKEPILFSLTPDTITNDQEHTIVLKGINFDAQAVPLVGGAPYPVGFFQVINGKTIEITVPVDSPASTYILSVKNPNDLISNGLPLTVNQASTDPVLNEISPNIVLNDQDRIIQLLGTGFDPNATVLVESIEYLLSTYIDSGRIDIIVLKDSPALTYQISIRNPDGKESDSLPLIVAATPELYHAIPSSVINDQIHTIKLVGKNFDAQAVPKVNGAEYPSGFFNWISPAEIQVDIPQGSPPAMYVFTVQNPQGYESGPTGLGVFNSSYTGPMITQLDPYLVQNDQQQTIRIIGNNFNSSSKMLVNSAEYPSTFIDVNTIEFIAVQNAPATQYIVSIQNDEINSNLVIFTVTE